MAENKQAKEPEAHTPKVPAQEDPHAPRDFQTKEAAPVLARGRVTPRPVLTPEQIAEKYPVRLRAKVNCRDTERGFWKAQGSEWQTSEGMAQLLLDAGEAELA